MTFFVYLAENNKLHSAQIALPFLGANFPRNYVFCTGCMSSGEMLPLYTVEVKVCSEGKAKPREHCETCYE